MSLLLDALKKAAEQKAEKSRQEEIPAASPSDETEITAAAEDLSELEQGAGHGLAKSDRNREDETELDPSEIRTRLERTLVKREGSDDTEIRNHDSPQTRTPSASSQIQTGEDETIVFDAEDVSDFLGEPELVNRETRSHGDATDFDQTEHQTQHEAIDAGRSGDDTEVDQTEHQTQHEVIDAGRSGDDTEVDQTEHQTQHEAIDAGRSGDDTEVDQTELQTQHEAIDAGRSGDDTEVEQTEHQTHHEAIDAGLTGDDTQLEQTEYQSQVETRDVEPSGDNTETQPGAIQDEDMSLLLVEHDDTNLTRRTSVTDPQTASYAQITSSDDAAPDELALVGKEEQQIPADETETVPATQTSATTAITSQTQATQGAATTRTEATSTYTYAPDNYDRTLMKLPSDDASKIFSGMKSDNDVVMTPDYAKKVFRSKSSAHRMQGYKVYTGIAVVIMLSVGIYGAFEFQHQSNSIDASLEPLKRDPMPGIIKPEEFKQGSDLFAESGTNARTIEIIENADNVDEIAAVDEKAIANEVEITDQAMATEDAVIEATTVEADNAAVMSASAAAVPTESVEMTQNVSITRTGAVATQPESSSSTLEILSSSKIEQKDLWLREAYDAYKSGNDSLAMTRYNQVLEIDPGNRNALLARAAINVQNNNGNAAIKDYQTLLLHNPKDSLAMTSLITVANYSPLETESQLKLMIRDEPNSPYLNFALANAYGAQNRWQEAQGYYFKALENNPGDPNYAYNLAVSLEHIAQPVAAVAYYRRALDNIDNGLATFNREVVSQRMETLAKQ